MPDLFQPAKKWSIMKLLLMVPFRAFAKILGEDEAVSLLEETLNEEKEADQKLTEVAESSINIQAADADSGEEEELKSCIKNQVKISYFIIR